LKGEVEQLRDLLFAVWDDVEIKYVRTFVDKNTQAAVAEVLKRKQIR